MARQRFTSSLNSLKCLLAPSLSLAILIGGSAWSIPCAQAKGQADTVNGSGTAGGSSIAVGATSSESSSASLSQSPSSHPSQQLSPAAEVEQAVDLPGAEGGGKEFVTGLKLPGNDFIPSGDSVLRGAVSSSTNRSPLLSGMVQSMPEGTKVDLTLMSNLNSEISQKGDEVFLQISRDVRSGDDGHILVPGSWVAHGYVVESVKPGRNGVAGHVEVKLDKLISPDGQTELPFECKLSTGDKKIVAVTKLVARDVGYGVAGAAAGGVLSVQMTGLSVAVATHGISVGVGAAVGGTLALIGAVRKKGNIYSGYPGDQLRLTTAEPIVLPGFNAANLPSAVQPKKLEGLRVRVENFSFQKDTFTGDKKARILTVKFQVVNYSKHSLNRRNLLVVSGRNLRYRPSFANAATPFDVEPQTERTATMSFSVDSPREKYFLVFIDDKGDEFNRVPIN